MSAYLSILHGLHLPNLKNIEYGYQIRESRLDGSTLQTSIFNGNHEASGDLAGAPQSKKGKAYELGESRSILISGCRCIVSC